MSQITRENPARPSEEVGRVTVSTAAEVDAVVTAADAGLADWANSSVAARAHAVRAAWQVDADELGTLLARELGKVRADAVGETAFAGMFTTWVTDHAPAVLASRETDDEAGRLLIEQRPFGVVAAITPWNAPVILTMLKVAPALVAGNCIVVKPSPLAPLAVTRVLDQLASALPTGVLSVVNGGADTGGALVGHPLVRKVAFTGGGVAARVVGAAAAAQLTPLLLQLGGNDPAVFLEDAEITESVAERLLVAAFATSGQVCMAVKRVYAHAAVAAQLVDALRAVADRTLTLGDPLDPAVTLGPMVTRDAAARVAGLVDQARASGGDVMGLGQAGEIDPDGYYCPPTLVLGLDDDVPLVRAEQFGPALPLLTFTDTTDAIRRANAGELGLGASVWSRDEDRAFGVARQLEAGFRFVNTHNRAGLTLRAPFGGVKRSGFGREYSVEGIAEYTQPCVVHVPASARNGGRAGGAAAYPSG